MIYYSHSMKIYGTRREKKEIKLISKYFPRSSVYNPNNAEIKTTESPMDACLQVINDRRTSGIVFSVYRGHVGKGVYTEVERALELGIFVLMIRGNKIIPFTKRRSFKVVDVDWAVEYAKIVKGGD